MPTTGALSIPNFTTKMLALPMKLRSVKTKLLREMEVSAYLMTYCYVRRLNIAAASQPAPKIPAVVRRTSSVTEEDRENALKVRKNALKSNGSMFFYETPFIYPVKMTPLPKQSTSRTSLDLPSPSPALPPRITPSRRTLS